MSHTEASAADPFQPGVFYQGLVETGLILPTGVKGVWGRGPVFEDLLQRFDAFVMRDAAGDGATELTFPPVVPRTQIEQLGYLDNFPQLAGSVHSFSGSDAKARELSERVHAGERWEDLLGITDVMLTPAACYPVYPLFSGLLPETGRLVTTKGWCFRHEPSDEPTRLQSFRMREFIRIGTPEAVEAWRDAWLQRGLSLLQGLGLKAESDVANDPFFGRAGAHDVGQPAGTEAEVRDRRTGHLGRAPDRDLLLQLAPGALHRQVRHPPRRRPRGAHRLPGLRSGARHAGLAEDARPERGRLA